MAGQEGSCDIDVAGVIDGECGLHSGRGCKREMQLAADQPREVDVSGCPIHRDDHLALGVEDPDVGEDGGAIREDPGRAGLDAPEESGVHDRQHPMGDARAPARTEHQEDRGQDRHDGGGDPQADLAQRESDPPGA